MSGYSNGIQMTYLFAAFAGISSIGQSSERAVGPKGLTGRLVAMSAVVTTANTTAAGGITLQDIAGAETFGSLSIPVASIDDVANDLVIDDVSDSPADNNRIPADTALELDGDGLGTLGVADVYVTIEWS